MRRKEGKHAVGIQIIAFLAAADDAAFHQVLDILRGAARQAADLFADALRVVQKENRFVGTEIQRRKRRLLINGQVPVDGSKPQTVTDAAAVRIDVFQQLFGEFLTIQPFQKSGDASGKRLAPILCEVRRQLQRRRDPHMAQVFGAALCRNVKSAHRVNFIAEEFDADRAAE